MNRNDYQSEWIKRAQKIAQLGIWDQNPETDELWWSNETYKILGLAPQSINPNFNIFIKMVHPGDRDKVIIETDKALKSIDHPYKVDYRIIRPDQTIRYVHEEALIERDEMGNPARITGIIKDITEQKQYEEELKSLVKKLQSALDEVEVLRGILPICSSCKKIRTDSGYWEQIEVYISKHSDALFSHGICPDCSKKLYPEYFKEDK